MSVTRSLAMRIWRPLILSTPATRCYLTRRDRVARPDAQTRNGPYQGGDHEALARRVTAPECYGRARGAITDG
jgi:hypothetical protein